jgi:hypothetical protein
MIQIIPVIVSGLMFKISEKIQIIPVIVSELTFKILDRFKIIYFFTQKKKIFVDNILHVHFEISFKISGILN